MSDPRYASAAGGSRAAGRVHVVARVAADGGQGVADGGEVGLEFGALVGVVDHAQEGAVGVAALGGPGGLVVGVQLALARALS
jgi:hypothetical protein